MTTKKAFLQGLVVGSAVLLSASWLQAAHPHVPDIRPDWGEDPLTFWARHPYNPDGTNYDVTINSPGSTVNLASGGSIGSAAGSGNKKIVLVNGGTYGGFSLHNKKNVHVICESSTSRATITGGRHPISPSSAMLDYAQFAIDFQAGNATALAAFQNVSTNYYFKNIRFYGSGAAYSFYLQRVRNLFCDHCKWEGFAEVTGNLHHRGQVIGNLGNFNIFFHNCEFYGQEEMVTYLDGAQYSGFVNCYAGPDHSRGGFLFLVNDDYSKDVNADGIYQRDEQLNPKYTIMYKCVIDEYKESPLLFSQSDHYLIMSNTFNGSHSGYPIIDLPDRCSALYANLSYEAVNLKFIGNRVRGNPGEILDIRERKNTPSVYAENYARIGRYVIRDNVFENALGTIVTSSGDVVGPNFVENNNNGSTIMPTRTANALPTIALNSPAADSHHETLRDIPISATIADADGSVQVVDLYIDDVYYTTYTNAPYNIVFPWEKALTGTHEFKLVATDNHGDSCMARRDIVIDAPTDETNAVFSATSFDVKGTVPVNVSKTASINKTGASHALLIIKPNDIDQPPEARLFMNEHEVDLPISIVGNGAQAVTREIIIPMDYLVNGVNTMRWQFADNIGGSTSGYSLDNSTYIRVKYGTPDAVAPSTPSGLSLIGKTDSTVDFRWTASTDNVAVAGYTIYRDGASVGNTSATNFHDTGLSASTAYGYRVAAFDGNGNVSATSAALNVTTEAPDTQAPTTPSGLTCVASNATSISMAWNAATDNYGVAGYRLFRNGSLIAQLSGTSYADTGLNPASTHNYAVCAYDAAGNVSSTSAPVAMSTADADAIPLPWQTTEIGSALGGTTTYDAATERFTIKGSGRIDSTGTADSFHYLYRPYSGDFEIYCQVLSITGQSAYARAGVMIRETFDANGKSAWCGMDQAASRFRWRATAGGNNSAEEIASVKREGFVRLVRSNNVFTAYAKSASQDPWTPIGASQAITMSNQVYIGVMVNADGTILLATGVVAGIQVNDYLQAGEGGNYVWIEAEEGTVTAPFCRATNALEASGGQFVTTVTNTGANYATAGDPAAGKLTMAFTAPSASTYAVWGRFLAASGADDSFFNRLDAGVYSPLVDLAENSVWEWTLFVTSTNLDGGAHTLEICQREDGLLFDKFLVTSDLSYTPSGQGVSNDSDEDGLPDAWELQFFGSLAYGSGSDTDGDGLTAYQEYIAGTAPTSAVSVLAVERITTNANGYIVSWQSANDRIYTVQWSTNIEQSGFNTLQSGIQGAPQASSFTDTVHGGAQTIYYRVRAAKP